MIDQGSSGDLTGIGCRSWRRRVRRRRDGGTVIVNRDGVTQFVVALFMKLRPHRGSGRRRVRRCG